MRGFTGSDFARLAERAAYGAELQHPLCVTESGVSVSGAEGGVKGKVILCF